MSAPPPAPSGRPRGAQQRMLRIIAGRWRGRRFRFPPLDIRPTPDRVRETLFNWLQPRIEGAHCLDLYAGSGALGLEALSRGAASVLFVEQQRAAATALERLLHEWQASGATVLCTSAPRLLAGVAPRGFDLVFLDPPYSSALLAPSAAALERGWLRPDARIYLERARRDPAPVLPARWRELRAGTAGEVGYHLYAA
ncbi:MAG TPA: 16S rRNA (guanine(966)-N(2))-methyltransferase RsmD [Steroidobacteraceae bacterium]|nr:16S rRNA (guanine(966)-N(2))-methyltransferase RsmD [Steroidobacteraceae bacterium]